MKVVLYNDREALSGISSDYAHDYAERARSSIRQMVETLQNL
jgi:hypothetical protein